MLKTRVITAVVLLILIDLCLCYWPSYVWTIFCTILLACAVFEWTRFASYSKAGQNLYIILTLSVTYCLLVWLNRQFIIWFYIIAAFFWCVIAPLWLKKKWWLSASPLRSALCGWIIILPGFDILYQAHSSSAFTQKLFFIILIVWIADSAAYFTGRIFGRHKLAPVISPGKSWEGVLGAVITVGIYAIILAFNDLAIVQPLGLWLMITGFLTAMSIVGDLLESLFKRQIAIKNSSGLLPGHGGVLDRLDSLLALLPFAGILMLWT